MEGASVLLLQQEIPEKVNVAAALVAKAKGLTVLQDAGGEDGTVSNEGSNGSRTGPARPS